MKGTDEVKNKGTEYLPRLDNQTWQQYEAYKTRAMFYGASKRTSQGLVGAVFRKEPSFKFPDKQWMDNATIGGESLFNLTYDVTMEIIQIGRIGLLVDVPPSGEGKPYISSYTAENIINWKTKKINGRMQLSMVVLREPLLRPEDEFKDKASTQYRVLQLIQENGEWVYKQRLFHPRSFSDGDVYQSDSDEYIEIRVYDGVTYPVMPKKAGRPLDYIPFQFINATSLTPETVEPPLMELVETNLSHYRNSADLEHGAHYTALPTAWVAGFESDNNKELTVGSAVAWVASDPQARAGYLEFTGAGLRSIMDLMNSKELKMAVLGSRMLEEQKRESETAEALRLRMSGESGTLLSISRMIQAGLVKTLSIVAEWMNYTTSGITVELNKDYVAAKMTPHELISLMQALQAKAISFDTFYWNLSQGEMLPPDFDKTKEMVKIEKEGHMVGKQVEIESPTNYTDQSGMPSVSTGGTNPRKQDPPSAMNRSSREV
jgi:hypothetical protein